MFRNHIKLAWRNLLKGKVYSAFNILGLSIGTASCLLILLYITKELSYDTFHTKAERIYRVSLSYANDGVWASSAPAPAPLGATLQSEIPEIESSAQLSPATNETIVELGTKKLYESRFVYATPSLFDIFDFPLVTGEAGSLKEPHTVLLSESMAAKYFPKEEPVGKLLIIDNKETYKVTGIFKDIPDNSHINFDFVASLESLYTGGSDRNNWFRQMHTYVVLDKHANPDLFKRKLDELKYGAMSAPYQIDKSKPSTIALTATLLTDIHLHSEFSMEMMPQGNIVYIYIFSAIALLILLIACINYMNLATALAVSRGREVGVRKAHGALRFELVRQYLSESFLFVGISLILALMLAELVLPQINFLMQRHIVMDRTDPRLFLMFGGLWLTIGLGAGLYPALYLSGLSAWRTLKSQMHVQSKGTLRKVLITFQLAVSIALIACTLVIQNQMALVRDSRPGFNQAQVIMIPTRNELSSEYKVLRQKLLGHSIINSVTTSSFQPGEAGMINFIDSKNIEGLTADASIVTNGMDAGFDFEKTFELRMLEGRSFDENFETDLAQAILVNEAMVRKMGWKEPLGKMVNPFRNSPRRVVGVIEDFHIASLRDEIAPLIIIPTDKASRFISVRVNAGDIAAAVQLVESAWKEVVPQLPFSYSFLDESFDALYRTELRFNTLVTVFSLLAIFVACLGLIGLSAFTARQRTKEIGIRKTLGATASSIVRLLTADFLKWATIGLIIAIPGAHFAMYKWLETFKYKVDVGAAIYLAAGIIVMALVLLSTCWQSLTTALKNPVDSLKHE